MKAVEALDFTCMMGFLSGVFKMIVYMVYYQLHGDQFGLFASCLMMILCNWILERFYGYEVRVLRNTILLGYRKMKRGKK
jgi:hypothetical protein